MTFWMLLDERNDIIHLLLRWLEATFPILRDNELITTHPSALTVSTHIRRITQAISLVQMIPCVHQYFLYAQPTHRGQTIEDYRTKKGRKAIQPE